MFDFFSLQDEADAEYLKKLELNKKAAEEKTSKKRSKRWGWCTITC